jgi:hypothetical protein
VTDTQPRTEQQDDLHRERASVQRLQQHLALSLAREQQAQDALNRQRARADHAEGEAERRLGLLRRLEWVNDDGIPVCPVCSGLKEPPAYPPDYPVGHDPEGCWLAAELEPGRG